MFKKSFRIISFVLALVMMMGVFSACSKEGTTDTGTDGGAENTGKIEFLVDPEEYRGTKVIYATWKDPAKNEDGPVVENFKKKYGIDVEIMLLEQASYLTSIAASIASGTQPDIFFENGYFPGALSVMQPLDNAKINLNDPIWNQATIENSKLNGHPYLVDALSNVWSEVDICVYNKKIFEDNNITTPAEYYEAGKWTFEAFKECAKQVAALGDSYVGAEVIGEVALAAANCTFFKLEGDKMVSNVNDRLYDVMTFLAQMKADGQLELGLTGFTDGKTGLALTNCFALKKTGYYTTINPDHLGVTFLPVWEEGEENVVSGTHRGWGLVKGAKNPVAAGIFLREYLDVNNYDLANTFHSEEVSNFFFKATGLQSENMLFYYDTTMGDLAGIQDKFVESWNNYSPAQIKGHLQSQTNVFANMVEKANSILDTEKAWLDENYK